ncbi:MAG TPA: hypothetical protein VFO62_07545, partial [Candidatus Binatia bacterium]|nr:hypothetical protein [Candidatus Binatia bacterium]
LGVFEGAFLDCSAAASAQASSEVVNLLTASARGRAEAFLDLTLLDLVGSCPQISAAAGPASR